MTLERGMQIAQGLSSAGNSIQNTLHQANAEERRQKRWEWKKDEHETNEQTDKLTNKLTSEIQSKMEETGDPTTGLQAAQKLTDKWAENEEYDPSAIRKARANAFTNVSNQLNFNSKAIQYKSQKLEQERQELTQKLSGSMSAIQDGNYSDNDIQNVLQVATKAPNDKDYRLKDGVVYEKGVNADWSNSEEVNKTPVSEFNLEKVSQNLSAQLHPETYTKKKLQAEFATRETNAENQKNPYVLKNPDTGDTIYYAPQQDPYSQEHSGLIADNSALNNAKGLKETNKDLSNYKRLGRVEDLESGDVSGDGSNESLVDTNTFEDMRMHFADKYGASFDNKGMTTPEQRKKQNQAYGSAYYAAHLVRDRGMGESAAMNQADVTINQMQKELQQLQQQDQISQRQALEHYRRYEDVYRLQGDTPETVIRDLGAVKQSSSDSKKEEEKTQNKDSSGRIPGGPSKGLGIGGTRRNPSVSEQDRMRQSSEEKKKETQQSGGGIPQDITNSTFTFNPDEQRKKGYGLR